MNKNEINNILQFWKLSMNLKDKDLFYIDDNEERDLKKALTFKDGFLYYNYLVEIDSETLDIDIIIDFVSNVINSLLEKKILVIPSCDYEDDLPINWKSD